MTLLVLCVTGAWAEETTVTFTSSNKNDAGSNFASMSNGDTQLVGNGLAKLIATNSCTLNTNSANKNGYRADRVNTIFKFDGVTTLDIFVNSNNTSKSFALYSFSSEKALNAITTSDYSTKTIVSTNISVTGTTFSNTNTSCSTSSVSSGNVTINQGGTKVTYTSLPAGYYVMIASNELYFYSFTANVTSSTPTSYTVTYNANGGSGTIANSTGTDITLSDGTGFTAPENYSFAGWNTANDGSGTSYAAGQTNVNADLDLFATWTQDGTIDANTGSANTTYTATLNATSIAIAAAPTKDGHVINGYYTAATDGTKVANADGTLVASTSYADEDGKWNNSAAAPTLYAQWGDPDYVFTPTGTISGTSLSNGDEVESSTGGKMVFTSTEGTLKYTNTGLEFGSKSACQVTVTLDRLMQVGTKISVTLYNTNDDKERGLVLKNISGTTKATMTEQNKEIEFTKTYTVVADDGLAGSNQFVLQRSNNTYLRKVVVTNCVQPKEITITDLSAIDGSTYTGKNYATLYYSDVALAVPSGVKAYTYKMDGEALVVSRTYENGGTYPVIPAGEAVVVESESGASYNFNVATTATTVDTNSLLKGTDASTTIDESGYKYYKLAMNDALTSVGFYFAVVGGTSITNGAHKAYLRVSTTASKEYFVLGGEGVEEPQNETDGINAVDIAIANGATIYNLAGQKVGANYKGIVVINGKKVVRK